MVTKPSGKYRFCLDFQKVNGVSKKDAYPLPNMNSIIDKLRSAHYISTIDLSQANLQIPLAKDSREITAFSVPSKSLYHFTRMPYGLTGAPATFQHDIVIVTPNFDKHLEWLERVLNKLTDAGLTINPEKCEFCRLQFATVSKPLTRLLKKDERWDWGSKQQQAFERIPAQLSSASTLSYPNFNVPFILQTDASSVGLGAVLIQQVDSVKNIIVFASRALSDPKKKYSVTEQECLAVIWAIQKFRPYLEGYRFTVVTDHSGLRWLHNLKNPTGAVADKIEMAEDSLDPLYIKRFRKRAEHPKIFTDWKVVVGELYYCRPRATTSEVIEDLNQWKLVLPSELREEALRKSHDNPQANVPTYQKVLEQASPAGLMGHRMMEAPWMMIAADIMGPLPRSKSGFAYILVIQDLFTKWVECRVLRAANGKKIRETLEDLILSRWGTPKFLVTDNGTEFVNQTLPAFAQEYGITHTTVPPYYPQAKPRGEELRTGSPKTSDLSFGKGELVLKKQHTLFSAAHNIAAKLSPRFARIAKSLSPVYELAKLDGTPVGKVHIKDLKSYRFADPDQPPGHPQLVRFCRLELQKLVEIRTNEGEGMAEQWRKECIATAFADLLRMIGRDTPQP
ncbi:uncharacterized protein K02A2.6-like [Solenopsis invicta]|uniref:uncharacterized protein K02A2.6-like n=1 Tax=Solenopsis invicta TaxID=13686 RepID=UPI00193DBA3B|nr:uncharacterized protein K02A2.6-like [Solenopsis invicta]